MLIPSKQKELRDTLCEAIVEEIYSNDIKGLDVQEPSHNYQIPPPRSIAGF